jgi:DNA polymerase I-like protein with 3'-5' exonuclease and polymerase domains
MTVASGPNILLLKKEHRHIIKSSFTGGSVVYLDFSSLEARVLLYESGGSCEGSDLYTSIAEKIGNVNRDAVKLAVLAELYGSSKNSLALTLGLSDTNLHEFIKRVGEVINTRDLLVTLKKQFAENGYIRNKFGRKLEIARPQDNIFINYYAQSTGVDVALLGFNNIMNTLGTDGIRPLFVLHDALVLDVREDRLKDVERLTDVQVPGFSSKFPLKLEKL